MASRPEAIRTKLGQPSTSSPRTLESNRRRLGSLFSTLTLGSSASDVHATPTKSTSLASSSRHVGNVVGEEPQGWLSWLTTPTKSGQQLLKRDEVQQRPTRPHFSPTTARRSVARSDQLADEEQELSMLESLPDEILLVILLHLPPSLFQLLSVSLISRRFHDLSQSPLLWSELFDNTPGFEILPEVHHRLTSAHDAPEGRWSGNAFVYDRNDDPGHSALSVDDNEIPIHFPTLYRSRLELSRLIHASNPGAPPDRSYHTEHDNSVYCIDIVSPWLFTGARDHSIKIWRMPDLPILGRTNGGGNRSTVVLKTVENAHERSVLSIKFEMDADGTKGVLMTGSSDMTACLWDVRFPQNSGEEVTVEKTGTLTGHQGGVLDVALGKRRLATGSKDTTVRVYRRKTLEHLFTIDAHTGPVNGLALNPFPPDGGEELVSASSDGRWVITNMRTNEEVRSANVLRGFACVTWAGDYIMTGDNDRLIKLYDSRTAELIRTFEGHTDLVRTIAIDLSERIIVSGSYDETVRMWNLDTGELIRNLRVDHHSIVFQVATDRGRIVSVSHDRGVQVTTFGRDLPYRGLFA